MVTTGDPVGSPTLRLSWWCSSIGKDVLLLHRWGWQGQLQTHPDLVRISSRSSFIDQSTRWKHWKWIDMAIRFSWLTTYILKLIFRPSHSGFPFVSTCRNLVGIISRNIRKHGETPCFTYVIPIKHVVFLSCFPLIQPSSAQLSYEQYHNPITYWLVDKCSYSYSFSIISNN